MDSVTRQKIIFAAQQYVAETKYSLCIYSKETTAKIVKDLLDVIFTAEATNIQEVPKPQQANKCKTCDDLGMIDGVIACPDCTQTIVFVNKSGRLELLSLS